MKVEPKTWQIKAQAKKLCKELNIKHGQALELIVKELGYKNWNTYCGLKKKKENNLCS